MARVRNARGAGEQLRTELLAAAEAVLDATGDPSKVTVRGVASAVGVAPNAVYLHFADREALLAEIAIQRYEVCTVEVRASTAALADPIERLLAGHERYCELALERPGHYRLLFHGLIHPTNAALLERVAAAGLAYFQTCVDACAAAIDVGALHAPDAPTLAAAVWALEHGWCEIALTGDLGASILPSARTALETLLRAAR